MDNNNVTGHEMSDSDVRFVGDVAALVMKLIGISTAALIILVGVSTVVTLYAVTRVESKVEQCVKIGQP